MTHEEMTETNEQLDQTVDELTHQMVEAFGKEEDIHINQTIKREVTVFGE